MVAKIAALGNREDGTPLREEIAEHADVDELYRHCDKGFKPFVDKLRAALEARS